MRSDRAGLRARLVQDLEFLLPSLEELLAAKLPTRFLALAIASWLKYMKCRDEQRRPLHIYDAALAQTQRRLEENEPFSLAVLRFILGPKLALNTDFADQLRAALSRLDRLGVVATMDWCLRAS